MRCTSLWRTTSLWSNSMNWMPSISVEDVAHVDEARPLLARQVDLRDVARDDDLRAEAEARQEHLHLLRRGVLRLVEDDEAVVQGAAAHERERRDLDRPALDQVVRLVGVEHVVERVEERAQVRVDLRHQVAGQEAEPLAGLDGGAREDDPRHLALVQRGDRERHREVGLARAGGADPEGDRRAPDRVDVALLRDGLRRDLLAAVAPDDGVEDLAHVLAGLERPEHRVDGVAADLVAALDQLDELVDHRARALDVLVVALERQLVAAQADRALQPLAQRVEHAVGDPGQLGRDGVGDFERFLHPFKCRLPRMARKWWTLIAVCTATFMLLLDITIVNVALPAIQRSLNAIVLRPPVGRGRLRAGARDLRPHRRLARRPVRPQAGLPDRRRRSSRSPRRPAGSRTTRSS